MITVIRQGHTLVPVHTGHGTAAGHAAVHALQTRCLVTYAAGMRTASGEVLAHEAERLETQLSTPVIVRMRAIVAAEQTRRAKKRAERLRRVRNLKRCHEVKVMGDWHPVAGIETDDSDRDYVRIRLTDVAVPVRWRRALPITSRLAARTGAVA